MGKFFSKGEKFRVIRGNCYEVLPQLPKGIAQMVFTDPPYNLNDEAEEIHLEGREPVSKTADWDADFHPMDLVSPLKHVLAPNGNTFAFTSFNLFGEWHRVFNPLYDRFNFMVWRKVNPPCQVRKTSVRNAIEQIVMFWNRGHLWNFMTQQEMVNYIEGPICQGKERLRDDEGKTLHPTQKPLHALRRQILWCTNPGDVVLDPYGGTFAIGHATLELGRRYIGIELDDEARYFEPGKRRLEEVAAAPSIEQCLLNPWG